MNIKSQSTSKLEFEVTLTLSEQEANALLDIVSYGYDAFIKHFKEKLGSAYIEMHEKGCRSLFESVSRELPSHLSKFRIARVAFHDAFK